MPFIMALPYLALGVSPNFISAYFEAVSAFTTTGASALDPDNIPQALLLWRSLVQWFGGVCVATFAIVVLAALNLSGTGVHRSLLFTLDKDKLFTRLMSIGRIVLGVYALLVFICFAFLALTGTDMFTALCLSLSGVSTGGLMPFSGSMSQSVGRLSALILALFTVLGAMNIALLWDCIRLRRWQTYLSLFRNVESRGVFVLIGVIFMTGLVLIGPSQFFTILIESMFFVSSAGFDYDVIGLEMLPSVILIALALIGGSALSTAGGVKIIRLLLLFKHLSTDLGRLTHCLLYTSPSPRDQRGTRMPSSA